MLPISVCIISKNEEQYINECLSRLIKYDWEIVVIDTGSTDRTIEIARSYTPSVFHFDWIDDFSAARNYSTTKASNDYILIVDCDEYLEDSPSIEETISTLPQLIPHGQVGMVKRRNSTPALFGDSKEGTSDIIYDYAARFFHRGHAHFQGSIHEQLVSNVGAKLSFVPLPLCFHHIGYSTLAIRSMKAHRNIGLLQQSLEHNSSDPYLCFQMGQSYFGIGDYANALPFFERALSIDINEHEEYLQTLVESYGYSLLYLQKYQTALQLEGIYDTFSKRSDFVFLMGLIYMNNARFEQAISAFLHATSIPNYAVEGVNSYKAFYNIGVIYECTGNLTDAIFYYTRCGNYPPALHRLEVIK